MLSHPFTWLTTSTQKKAFVVLTLCAMALMLALMILGAPLKTEQAPLGIVSFEFAKTPLQAHRMIESWGQTGPIYAALNLGLDYLFLVLYPSSVALGCALLSETLRYKQRRLSGAGTLLSWMQFGAGGLDAVENFALIKIVFGSQQPLWPQLAWCCALIKFAIVAAGLGYVITGAVCLFIPFSGKGVMRKKSDRARNA